MCGIAGWYGWDLPREEGEARLRGMCDAIRHRGPDDAGVFLDGSTALGMRRLSIVDISGGRQPMLGADGSLVLVCNGEIYNHSALRKELVGQGAVFTTRSDTEVLLRLYERYGTEGLARCNGMFAAAVWDGRKRRLILARDRMGVKPLYYYWDGRRLLFASEIKAILAAGAFSPEVNHHAVWDYLTFRYVPGPHSIWKHIYKLPPGHMLLMDESRPEPHCERWWDIPYQYPSRTGRGEDFLRECTDILSDAVQLRMLADVPVGILLSGGLDSSVVAALAQRNAPFPIKTFSVAFEGEEGASIDERPFAREVAAHLGTEHHEVVIGQQAFCDSIPLMVRLTDEPLADLASIPLYHVCKLAGEQVKVVLSGEGSDEILAGYNFEVWARQLDAARRRSGLARILDFIRPLPEDDLRNWPYPLHMTNYFSSEQKRAVLEQGNFPDSLDVLRGHVRRIGKQHPLHQALYLYCQDWLVEDLLMKADRMSMGVSIELRTPFLDYRFVEWAAAIPPDLKAGPDVRGMWQSKRILRDLGRKLLPEKIITRQKMGFPVPAYAWLGNGLSSFARDLLDAPGTRIAAWFKKDALRAALNAGTAADSHIHDRHRLWHLLVLECWAREHGV